VYTYAIMQRRPSEEIRFVAAMQGGEIVAYSTELGGEDGSRITGDAASWPAWLPDADLAWAAGESWHTLRVVAQGYGL